MAARKVRRRGGNLEMEETNIGKKDYRHSCTEPRCGKDRVNKLGLWGGWGCCGGEKEREGERQSEHETKERDGASTGRGKKKKEERKR